MLVRLCAIGAMIMTLLGCGASTDEGEPMRPTEATKSGTGELRTDLEPLLKRFPVLEGVEQAHWMSGRFGDPDNPGPSTYWIDAVVTLPPATISRLRADHAPAPAEVTPDVVDGLREQLPAGPFLGGAALNKAFTHERWSASAYLDERTNQLVLVAISGN